MVTQLDNPPGSLHTLLHATHKTSKALQCTQSKRCTTSVFLRHTVSFTPSLLTCTDKHSALPFSLIHTPVDADGWEVLLVQQLCEGHTSLHGLDKDDHLVELQGIQEVKQFAVLLAILQLYVMLLETVKGKLRVVINIHLHWLQQERWQSKDRDKYTFQHQPSPIAHPQVIAVKDEYTNFKQGVCYNHH